MRLAGALLSCLVALSFAAAEPARQQDAAKTAQPKKETKARANNATKAEQKAAVDAIAASYTAIPFTERIAIQNDLVWTEDYNGLINGEFGDIDENASRDYCDARAVASEARHAVVLDVGPGTLNAQAIDDQGDVVDAFQIAVP